MKLREQGILVWLRDARICVLGLLVVPVPLGATCVAARTAAGAPLALSAPIHIDQIVQRVGDEHRSYLFVGEVHPDGPVKRFTVDLTNALVDHGYDVGLYVEGFRTDCSPTDPSCESLARIFDREAYLALLRDSKAPVHPIDPPQSRNRAALMAKAIADGPESIRVVLIGNSHVLYAGQPDARLWVFGGGVLYPNPGDVVEAFPRRRSLTFGLQEVADAGEGRPYSLRAGQCGTDYTLLAAAAKAY